ncbi:FIST N-terminal domain-containing protein [Emcibacter nanhaiensis]|uniref:FIST domain containing protein n=1 Tax=Emcibacter nanhaiensis TaxID=1505037 RepID=A0A501PGD4_9PROT|nr:FIST N-terminal domain-containing protein [Emcibacter nanhaiensis]TPD59117.1 FIST domain containing protein [Emcibacter nanhaiensis]
MTDPCDAEIKRAFSLSADERTAVREFYDGLCIAEERPEAVIFFCSPEYDTAVLEKELNRQFGDIPLIGCTTAGEITPEGYHAGSITGAALSRTHFTCVSKRYDRISKFNIQDGIEFGRSLKHELRRAVDNVSGSNSFAFMLIDGLSNAEERVTASLGSELGEISMIGGSTADDFKLKQTQIFHEGKFRTDSAVVMLVHTDLPFQVSYTHHYVASDAKAVITEADPITREVLEINGLPASQEYARLCGVEEQDLDIVIASKHPVMVKVGGTYFSRGVMGIDHEKHSIRFACAIDKGVVCSIARPDDPQLNLETLFSDISSEIGPLSLVIGCDCAARKMNFQIQGILDEMSQIYAANNVIGFASFGEQFNTLHMNNSFSCIAIGRKAQVRD